MSLIQRAYCKRSQLTTLSLGIILFTASKKKKNFKSYVSFKRCMYLTFSEKVWFIKYSAQNISDNFI